MDHETLLPPPPPTRIALWAVANVMAFRVVDVAKRLLRAAARHANRMFAAPEPPRLLGTLASEGHHSLVLERMIQAEDHRREMEACATADRPTAVEVRRT
ncbi:Hypothetical protein A7982_01012 [Minicystis rosea]|nr:Hypothetical protein A7982_01012 [Minicystis rosea]